MCGRVTKYYIIEMLVQCVLILRFTYEIILCYVDQRVKTICGDNCFMGMDYVPNKIYTGWKKGSRECTLNMNDSKFY